MIRHENKFVIALTAVAGLLSCGQIIAHAQDALGGGNALDANLNTGGRINNARTPDDYHSRNLLVTRDVAGGRGFRGAVGYSAARDFRGALGSNDTFSFLSGSAYSSPALFQLGSTYEQLRFGQAAGALEFRRAQSGAPASVRVQDPIPFKSVSELTGSMTAFDRLHLDRTSLANSTAVTFQTLVEPQMVGLTYNKENRPYVYNASSLRGITLEPANQSIGTIGLTTFDSVRLREDVERGANPQTVGTPFEPKFDEKPLPGADLRLNTANQGGRVENVAANMPADYTAIMHRIADRYAQNGQATTDLTQLQSDYLSLRKQLRNPGGKVSNRVGNRVGESTPVAEDASPLTTAFPGAGTTSAFPTGQTSPDQQPAPGSETTPSQRPTDSNVTPPSPLDGRPTDQRPGQQRPGETDQSAERQPPTPREMANVLRHGQRVEHLSSETNDRFNELLKSAEERLREGDYFVAERRFDRALRFSPAHPLAMAGMGHAQLGGGLYLSAALTLRSLLVDHPEMIDTTFSAELLPPRERLNSAIKTLRPKLEEPRDRGSYGFLFAYIGHQIGDRELAQQGIDAMKQDNPEDQLVPLLHEMWVTPPALRDSKAKPEAEPQK